LKIGIYNEPGGHGLGGSENVVAVLAGLLAGEHDVEIVHHIPALTVEMLAESSGAELGGVRLRFVEREHDPTPYQRNPLKRYRAARAWHASLSQPYDLFVASLHDIPPFCHANSGALIILFPSRTSPHVQAPAEMLRKSRVRQRVERAYQRYEWKQRIERYHVVTSISEFTRLWTTRRWGLESQVVHPPVNTHFQRVEKENLILSVGRFAVEGEGHTKKQPEMLAAFRELEDGLRDWEYLSVGGLRDSPGHLNFFRALSEQAAVCRRAQVLANVERRELRSLFERASIFWHAAGYGVEAEDPVLMEHFGISTVEAMAAGCVPVVINRGGQREIVEHGATGFLWDTLAELREYTLMLASDHGLRRRMAEAARERAHFFSQEEFAGRFLGLLRPLFANWHTGAHTDQR
jgi:glycosyltransferase involved in cell wall biosynthesis